MRDEGREKKMRQMATNGRMSEYSIKTTMNFYKSKEDLNKTFGEIIWKNFSDFSKRREISRYREREENNGIKIFLPIIIILSQMVDKLDWYYERLFHNNT